MTTEVSGREVARRLRGDGNRTGIRQAAQAKLSVNQMCWRRRKILQLGENKFKSEFPINAVDCFQFAEAELAFIPGELIARAASRNSMAAVRSLSASILHIVSPVTGP